MNVKILIYCFIYMILNIECSNSSNPAKTLLQVDTTAVHLGPNGSGIVYYVSNTGSDKNPGTVSAPFRTVQKAANVVKPGDNVMVDNGTYTSNSGDNVVTLTRSGTADHPITFISKNKYGAVLDGQDNKLKFGFVFEKVSYVYLKDFEFKGFGIWTIHVKPGSSHIEISGNHIHNIGRYCTSTDIGIVGCYLEEATDVVFKDNLLHDIGRFADGENGCSNSNANYMNHDHGLYLNGVTNVIANNNIFYNIQRGQGIHIYSSEGYGSTEVKIINNTFAFGNPYSSAGHIIVWGDLANTLIANNIFYSQKGSGIQVYQGPFSYTNVEIKNNVAFLGDGTVVDGTASGVSESNNFNKTDPKMINPRVFNFKLQSSSPVINAGFKVGLTTDYSGNKIVGLPDIGALEYTGSAEPEYGLVPKPAGAEK